NCCITTSVYHGVFFFFFFQAEDGIRDGHVTGVQTCALPISARRGVQGTRRVPRTPRRAAGPRARPPVFARRPARASGGADPAARSEERRVGKECRSRGAQLH